MRASALFFFVFYLKYFQAYITKVTLDNNLSSSAISSLLLILELIMKNVNAKHSRRNEILAAVFGTVAMFGLFYWMAVIATN